MNKEELYNKLDSVKKKLEKAHDDNDSEKINFHLKELNQLWESASVEMFKNAKKDGFYRTQQKLIFLLTPFEFIKYFIYYYLN